MNWDFQIEPKDWPEIEDAEHGSSCVCLTCEAEGPYAPDYDEIELEEAE